MLIAEIRRKLPSIDDLDADDPDALEQLRGLLRETNEDLLTADVFGALKYLPRRPYLETVLATLVHRNPASREFRDAWPLLQANVQSLEFRFWPGYPTPVGLSDGWTEPDVQLADERTLLLFEAKLNSAFGDRQLERELAVAAMEAQGREFFVVLVTPGSRAPRFRFGPRRLQAAEYLAALAESNELSKEARSLLGANRNRVLWISWETIHAALHQAHRQLCQNAAGQGESVERAADLLGDLDALMRLRQIQPFVGLARAVARRQPCQNQDHRPVFLGVLDAISDRNARSYELARALSTPPTPASWRCPAPRGRLMREEWIPMGTCCEKWRLELGGAEHNHVPPQRTGLAINRSNR